MRRIERYICPEKGDIYLGGKDAELGEEKVFYVGQFGFITQRSVGHNLYMYNVYDLCGNFKKFSYEWTTILKDV